MRAALASACTARSPAPATRRRGAASTRGARARSRGCAPRSSRRGRTTPTVTATAAISRPPTWPARSVGELRVGIVGAGWIGETHAATLAALDGVRLVARADARPGRAEYADWRELIARERLDAVLVCTPPDAHRDIAVAAAAAGLAVYLEKPVAHRAE